MKMRLKFKGDWHRLKHIPGAIEAVADSAAKSLAIEALNDMHDHVKKNKSMAGSFLIGSLNAPQKLGHAHYRAGPSVKYGFFVEHGRSPGKRPPKNAILEWMKAKGIRLPEKQMEQVAFLIARKIGKKGTKPRPFVAPVARKKKWRDDYARLVNSGIKRRLA